MWQITEFAAKMNEAKENGTVLKSPTFYTHEYGYKIRVNRYINSGFILILIHYFI